MLKWKKEFVDGEITIKLIFFNLPQKYHITYFYILLYVEAYIPVKHTNAISTKHYLYFLLNNCVTQNNLKLQ